MSLPRCMPRVKQACLLCMGRASSCVMENFSGRVIGYGLLTVE